LSEEPRRLLVGPLNSQWDGIFDNARAIYPLQATIGRGGEGERKEDDGGYSSGKRVPSNFFRQIRIFVDPRE